MSELIDLNAEAAEKRRAMLVGIRRSDVSASETEGLLDELAELAKNLEIDVVGREVVLLREPSAHYFVGAGKFSEIVAAARALDADCIIFDDELSPAQQRNWESESGLDIVNRQEVILDIFAARAQTREAVLQVELARLEYSLPRLRKAWSHLDRQRGGGITQRGGGESQLELDRRFIGARIAKLRDELERVRVVRGTQRKRRMRVPVPTAAVVGYTNAGKSSLINALAKSSLLAQDKLFATLDPTTRRLVLPDSSELLLTDTVGFVRKLPHRFVEAFKSTLEEAVVSDFLLHVVDSSSPDAAEHIKTTTSVLRELGADSKKIIVVMNKIDALSDDVSARALEIEFPDAVWVSAKTGEGLGGLLAKMEDAIAGASKLVKLLVPHSEYRAVAELYASGSVLSRCDTDDGAEISARIPLRKFPLFEKWISK
ncbi:MAG: GTPase HflX [Candidatus Merdousia sp.]|nr:GTPase HflX [Candidatus Merdousia sp.]